jgi:hypothetical protein
MLLLFILSLVISLLLLFKINYDAAKITKVLSLGDVLYSLFISLIPGSFVIILIVCHQELFGQVVAKISKFWNMNLLGK